MIPNQQEAEIIVDKLFNLLKNSYKQGMFDHYFKGRTLDYSSYEVRENFARISVAAMSKFIANEINRLSNLQNIDNKKVRGMFFLCIEKFLNDKGS